LAVLGVTRFWGQLFEIAERLSDPGLVIHDEDSLFDFTHRHARDDLSYFHGRCNAHRNTVTLILSTNDCIFGRYTPVAWTSRGDPAADPSVKGFLFTIKRLIRE
jgi:hypothetical protein